MGDNQIMNEKLKEIRETVDSSLQKLDELVEAIKQERDNIKQEIGKKIEMIKLGQYNKDEIDSFLDEPYVVIPKRENEFYVIAPRWVDFQIGWLDRQTKCFDEQTRILSDNGFKYFYELKPEDKVATFNPITNELEFQRPINFFVYDYNGKMIHFKGQLYDFLITPNHNMFCKFKWRNKWEFIEAQKLLHSNYQVEIKRDAKWNCVNKQFFELPSTKGSIIPNPNNSQKKS